MFKSDELKKLPCVHQKDLPVFVDKLCYHLKIDNSLCDNEISAQMNKNITDVRKTIELCLNELENDNKVCKNFWKNLHTERQLSFFCCGIIKIPLSTMCQAEAVARFASILHALDPNDEHNYLERLCETHRKQYPTEKDSIFLAVDSLKEYVIKTMNQSSNTTTGKAVANAKEYCQNQINNDNDNENHDQKNSNQITIEIK